MPDPGKKAAHDLRRSVGAAAGVGLVALGLLLVALALLSSSAVALPPVVTLTSPVGGEDWTGGSVHNVLWSVTDPDTLNVSYWINTSSNGGATWTPLASGLVPANGSPHSTPWTVPLVNSTGMIVRVCAMDNLTLVCAPSLPFTADSTPPAASPTPVNGLTGVPPNAAVKLDFSEPMQNATPPLSAVTFSPNVTVVSLSWVTPTELAVGHASFTPAQTYTWTLACSVRDASDPGNPISGCGTPLWMFRANVPPSVGSLAVDGASGPPATQSVPNDRNPTFSWVFQDPDANATQVSYEWEVLDGTTSAVVSAPGPVTSGLHTANYAGPTLVAGTCYVLRVRVYDGFSWSPWASLGFCLAASATPPFALSALVLPSLIVADVVAVLVVVIRPPWYRLADAMGVILSLYALYLAFSQMVPSLAPFRFEPSLAPAGVATVTIISLVAHFLPEPGAAMTGAGAARLDPSPRQKAGVYGMADVVATGLGLSNPLTLPATVTTVAASAAFGGSLWSRRREKRKGVGA